MILYEDLSEFIDPSNEPLLDRPQIFQSEMLKGLPEIQQIWAKNGVVVVENLLPNSLMDDYLTLRRKSPSITGFQSRGFSSPVPYMYYKEIRNISLFPDVMHIMESLIGQPVGLHLNLCNLKSTQRDWHSDWHLNPAGVNGYYIANWMALDDIHPDSGPFEFVPGSHRWPVITQKKVFEHLSDSEKMRPDWPAIAERFLTPAIEEKIEREGIAPMQFTAKKGSVLFWHSALIHRGSKPKNPDLERLGLINHYSGAEHRSKIDMPSLAKWGQSLYFVHENHPLDEGNPAPTV